MKAGEFSIPPGPLGCRPDLSGLSCRFEAMPARRGVMLSIIVHAANLNPAAPEATAYRALIENIIRLVEESPDMARLKDPATRGGGACSNGLSDPSWPLFDRKPQKRARFSVPPFPPPVAAGPAASRQAISLRQSRRR
jgi:hypothetical protein